jgi:hypothetical protein
MNRKVSLKAMHVTHKKTALMDKYTKLEYVKSVFKSFSAGTL